MSNVLAQNSAKRFISIQTSNQSTGRGLHVNHNTQNDAQTITVNQFPSMYTSTNGGIEIEHAGLDSSLLYPHAVSQQQLNIPINFASLPLLKPSERTSVKDKKNKRHIQKSFNTS